LGNPKPWPKSTSPALGAANFNHVGLNDAWFTPVTYAGAFKQGSANNWMATWANFTPVKTDYTNGSHQCAKSFTIVEQPIASVITVDAFISPNPNKGNFAIDLKGFATAAVNVRIADMHTGKVYFVGKAANNSTTKISIQVSTGNYIVELTDGKNVISRKVSILN
jgi:hypothetical protein